MQESKLIDLLWNECWYKVAFQADLLPFLNNLSKGLEDSNNTILTSTDKITVFKGDYCTGNWLLKEKILLKCLDWWNSDG